MDFLFNLTTQLWSTAENTTNRLFAPLEQSLSPLLPFQFNSTQIAFAPKFLLLSFISLLVILCGRATLWYVKAKARLDRAQPDDILADRELRALRRALLMVDVTRHVPRLINNVSHWRTRKRIYKEGDRGDGMVSLHSGTSTLDERPPPPSPSSSLSSSSSTSTLRYASQAERAKFASKNDKAAATRLRKKGGEEDDDGGSEDGDNNHDNGDKNDDEKEGLSADVLRVLQTHTLFQYVNPSLLALLAQSVQVIHLMPHQVLFQCGSVVKTPSLYIMRRGRIHTYVESSTKKIEGGDRS